MNALAVGLGGAIGALLRYAVSLWMVQRDPERWPWATLLVNVIGSGLLGGIVFHSIEQGALSQPMRLFLAVGLCGGFTTMSTFAFETLEYARMGLTGRAAAYALVSVTLSVAAVFVGGAAAQWVAGR